MANLPTVINNAVHDGSETLWLSDGSQLLIIGNETDGKKVGVELYDAKMQPVAGYAITKIIPGQLIKGEYKYVYGYELEGGRKVIFTNYYNDSAMLKATTVDFPA
jgi:hypothetical protein